MPLSREDADGSSGSSGGSQWDRGTITPRFSQEREKKVETGGASRAGRAPPPAQTPSAPSRSAPSRSALHPREPAWGRGARLRVPLTPTSRCAGLFQGRGLLHRPLPGRRRVPASRRRPFLTGASLGDRPLRARTRASPLSLKRWLHLRRVLGASPPLLLPTPAVFS